jgi:hypothetical protein
MKTATIPQRNQRLYKCWNGELETVLFREQSISEGAYAETWLVFDPKEFRRIRCSIGSYFTTPHLAWKAELKSHQDGLKAQRLALKKAKEEIITTKATIARLKAEVARSSV